MSSDAMLNIKEVVDRNVQYASLTDLQKKGKQRFKVMKLGQFYSLIERAVANVVESRAVDLAEKDRKAIVDESNREFKRLFQERQAELQELQRKDEEVQELREKMRQMTSELDAERRRREEIENTSLRQAQEVEHQLRQESQRTRSEADTAKVEVQRVRGEADTARAEAQRVALELESERQRRQALEEAVQTTREHANTLGRDLESAVRQKEDENQQLRAEVQSLRAELQAAQAKIAEMDQMLRLAKERVEGGSRDLDVAQQGREQLEQTCRELEAQLSEARAEATAVARRAEEYEAKAASIAQEKGALSEDSRKVQEEHAAAERGRIEALEHASTIETELRSATTQLAETRAKLDTTLALAQDRDRVIAEKTEQLQNLREEGVRLATERDRAVEASNAQEGERATALRDELSRLADMLAAEKDQHQETMKELLDETRSQKELFNEVRQLRAQLDEAKAAEGNALAGLSDQLGGVAPILGEIQKTLEDGVPGKPGDTTVEDQIQAAIAMGMETIKDQINLHVHDVNEKRKKQLELKAVEAASVALDRLFTDKEEIATNVEVVEVRQRKGTGIGDNLAKLKALRATATVEATEGEES